MKKNKIYVKEINGKIGNNQSFCDVNGNNEIVDIKEDKEEISNLSIKEKINKLFNRNGYIFNVDVKIITTNKEYNTKIAGKVNNHLITLDNDIINIDDIRDVIIKNN